MDIPITLSWPHCMLVSKYHVYPTNIYNYSIPIITKNKTIKWETCISDTPGPFYANVYIYFLIYKIISVIWEAKNNVIFIFNLNTIVKFIIFKKDQVSVFLKLTFHLWCSQSSSILYHVIRFHFLLRLNNIATYVYAPLCLIIHSWMDIWAAYTSWLWWIMLPWSWLCKYFLKIMLYLTVVKMVNSMLCAFLPQFKLKIM